MKKKARRSGSGGGARAGARPAPGGRARPAGLLTLQRAMGNRATGDLVGERLTLLGAKLPPPRLWSGPGDALGATVYFGQGDFLLVPVQLRVVEELADQVKRLFEPTLVVTGHASTEGTDADNLALSKKRRLAVVSVLGSKLPKILKASFTGEARGESAPAVPETAKDSSELEQQRALNRRVDVLVLPATPPEKEKKGPDGPEKILRPRITEWPPRKPGESPEEYERRRRSEELSRELKRPRPKLERPKFSLEKAAKKKLSDGLRKLGVSPKWRKRITDAAVGGGISGAKKIVDETSLGGETKDAVKALLEAVFKQEF